MKWIKEELGFDFAFNYKEVHLDSILKKFAVEGVDCFFDNVSHYGVVCMLPLVCNYESVNIRCF